MRNLFVATVSLMLLTAAAPAGKTAPAPAPATPPAAPAAPVTVTVTGEAAIGNGVNVVEAKKRALKDALRKAVEQVMGTYVNSFSESKNFTLMQDMVGTATTGYVPQWKILKENVDEEEGIVQTTVEAQVAKGELDKSAAAISVLLGMKKERRVYVLINDMSGADMGGKVDRQAVLLRHGIFDALLREQLRQDGFITLDPNIVDGKLKVKSAIQAVSTPQEAAEIARAVDADVIIYGQVTTTPYEVDAGDQKVHRATAEIVLSVSTPDERAEIAGWQGTAIGLEHEPHVAVSAALRKGAAEATKGVRANLFAAWRNQVFDQKHIEMKISGLASMTAFRDLQNLLAQVPGVQSVSSARYSKGVGSCDLILTEGGDSTSLATRLEQTKFNGNRFRVDELSGSVLQVTLTK